MRDLIATQETKDGTLLFLPLCPSTNQRTKPVIMGGHPREILTKEAREYINNVGASLFYWSRARQHTEINTYTTTEMWFVLPRTNCDAHNYLKCLCDTLQGGKIFEDDRFILPHIRGVAFNAKNPEIVVKI